MRLRLSIKILAVAIAAVFVPPAVAQTASDAPLPSWRDTDARAAILDFVARVTDATAASFVPEHERIAVFDNDGTLWVEQPMYTQLFFAIDRVRALAPQRPEWETTEPFKSILAGDMQTALAGGEKAILEIVMATHAGMTTEEFEGIVLDWIGQAQHPRFKRLFTDCVYQPQRELMQFLRDRGFRVFIVSGGGIEFMRPWSDLTYGVVPAQVIGSSIVTEFQMIDGTPTLVRQPKINFIDDKAGKPVGIAQHIGQRPILAFGNSAGDLQMLQYTTIGNDNASLGLLLLHDDAEREYAYGPAAGLPDSHIGAFPQTLLDEAGAQGWIVVRMKEDWSRVFPER
jgi:phosphoserine phosphatase